MVINVNQHETHERHLQVQVQRSYDLCITTTNAMQCLYCSHPTDHCERRFNLTVFYYQKFSHENSIYLLLI